MCINDISHKTIPLNYDGDIKQNNSECCNSFIIFHFIHLSNKDTYYLYYITDGIIINILLDTRNNIQSFLLFYYFLTNQFKIYH